MHDKRATLARRLECLIKRARGLEATTDLIKYVL